MPPLRIPPHIVRTDIAPRNPTVHHFGEHRTSAVYSSPPSFLRGHEFRSSAPRPRVAASGRRGRSRPRRRPAARALRRLPGHVRWRPSRDSRGGIRRPQLARTAQKAQVVGRIRSTGGSTLGTRDTIRRPPRTGRIASLLHRRRRRRRRVREVPRTDAVVHN
jgi:hypothetical protein